jgi:hypothetical protein
MRRAWVRAFAIVLGASVASPVAATNLDLRIESGGQAAVTVAPGAAVPWSAVGQLSDGANEGLALFAFDLQWTGGALAPASAPSTSPMTSFARPLGLANPAGFGGTPGGVGRLIQVGGAQNTIQNTFAPFPSGSVVTDVAAPGQPVVLASGQLTAPMTPGTYTLAASNLIANVIREGETGATFWRVDKASAGTVTALVVNVGSGSVRRKR